VNLAVTGTATTIDSSALLYQQADQVHPISYKIPQVGTVLLAHHHPQVGSQPVLQQQVLLGHPLPAAAGATSAVEKKKDIIARAMREENIFDERGKGEIF